MSYTSLQAPCTAHSPVVIENNMKRITLNLLLLLLINLVLGQVEGKYEVCFPNSLLGDRDPLITRIYLLEEDGKFKFWERTCLAYLNTYGHWAQHGDTIILNSKYDYNSLPIKVKEEHKADNLDSLEFYVYDFQRQRLNMLQTRVIINQTDTIAPKTIWNGSLFKIPNHTVIENICIEYSFYSNPRRKFHYSKPYQIKSVDTNYFEIQLSFESSYFVLENEKLFISGDTLIKTHSQPDLTEWKSFYVKEK